MIKNNTKETRTNSLNVPATAIATPLKPKTAAVIATKRNRSAK
jgi:hypothetical protein